MRYKLSILAAMATRTLIGTFYPPIGRKANYLLNSSMPNVISDPSGLVALKRRGKIEARDFYQVMSYHGIGAELADQMFELSEQIAGIGELIKLRLRKEIKAGEYKERMLKVGISLDLADELLKIEEQRLDPDTVIRAWRRQLSATKEKPDYFTDLKDQGWTDDRIELLKKVTEFFPAPADLVRFAVREVYSPDIVSKYGQLENLPAKFITEAKKAGLPEDQAKNYWAAHWILPSAGQGFEMLHRGIINKEETKTLLQTLDIMPFWRDKLIDIAYNPYTRVDVRRMNKLGILDREQVKRAYLDLGYDPEKAENMTEFTIRYNDDPAEAEMTAEDKKREELYGLTRTAILKQYKEELITLDTTKTYLSDLGLTAEIIDFHTAQIDYDRETERIDGYIKSYHRLYVSGIVDSDKTIELLDELALPAAHRDYLMDLWDLEKIRKPSQPSKSELVRFTKKEIINLDTFKEKMADLGYAAKYIDWYVEDYQLANAK